MMPRRERESALESDPLWYKDAVIYELHVRAFYDSDADGVGDFRGLTQKLDYLQDLGVTAIWLLPFYPSPLKDDGYDISDYAKVHPAYGSLREFRAFVREAHKRGLRVITELVLNHTSDQHAWFQRARRAPPGSRWREYYVWSENPERYRGARVIFRDFESSNWAWDPVANAYYWHRFYSHQPDLNYESADVRRAMRQVVDFWLGMGVDGLRLDAVPYLHERERTDCENLPETHAYLKELRRHVDREFRDKAFLGEANQWPEDAAAYFGEGDECHVAFHFPVMPRLFMAVRTEDRYPIIEILEQTPDIPESCQWATFLRNHDELTLEMVTDEDRDYMYRVYAQDVQARVNLGIRRRLAPLLGRHRRRIELMNGLLFSLPGTPVLYYGDEIGMGDNIYQGDRNGVRTPMQWSADKNAGFSRANPQQLYLPVIVDPEYHYETVNVEAQQSNPHSLLWWMKRLIALRRRHPAFGRGSLEFLAPENRRVLAFLRRYGEECILVVANLSRFVQAVELDLGAFQGFVPVELFGHTEFPPIGELPYFITLGPHEFYWFSLQAQRVEALTPTETERQLPAVRVGGRWACIFSGRAKAELEAILPGYLRSCRWFGGKGRRVRTIGVSEAVPIGRARGEAIAYVTLLRVDYPHGEPETYVLPLAFAPEEQAAAILSEAPQAAVARLEAQGGAEVGLLYDALWREEFRQALLDAIGRRRKFRGAAGELVAAPTRAFRQVRGPAGEPLPASVLAAEQSNTSIVYGDRLILKIFRRPELGINPDLEIGRFLTEEQAFPHVSPVAGTIEYLRGRAEPLSIGLLQGFVTNEGDAWEYTLDALDQYFERMLAREAGTRAPPARTESLTALAARGVSEPATELVGPYLESARLLGRRTAELHSALAGDAEHPVFAPEPMSSFYRRSLHQSMRSLVTKNLRLLRGQLGSLSGRDHEDALAVLGREGEIQRRFRSLLERPTGAMRIRCHGDYHLGQVLHTGKDFIIIDFEGEPARALSERKQKRSPLWDVAGMLRSFHYAAHAALVRQQETGLVASEDVPSLEPWAESWHRWVSIAFLGEYLAAAGDSPFLPGDPEDVDMLLNVLLLEKAVYELGYELNNRPDWVRIPLRGILALLGATE